MNDVAPAAPVAHPAVETAYLAPDAVLYDERTGLVYRLNPAASAVWMLMDGTADAEAIARDVSEIFAVAVEQVRPDVVAAIEQFVAQGLLLTGEDALLDKTGPTIDVPDSMPMMLTRPPIDGEVAVPLRVFTRGGRALLALVSDVGVVDSGRLGIGGVVEVVTEWAFVAPDGASVAVGSLRWPLVGALVDADSLDEARGRLWSLGRGNRAGWEALLASALWVRVADGDVTAAIEDALA